LEYEETKEIQKVLRDLTKKLSVFAPLLQTHLHIIGEFDFVKAKAKLAIDMNANLPNVIDKACVELKDAYHPLLWLRNKIENKIIHPQTLTLTDHNRIICISGPNAGGKSITLKTVGLLQLMIQSGILVPVHPKSEMFFFEKIMTDIGDNQSIENHLSTYSSRLKKMSGIIREADANTLLLIDEFDVILDKIHNNKITMHADMPTEVYNKTTWNTLLDDINIKLYPYVIIILTSNLSKDEIDLKYDPSYIRNKRVNIYHNLL
jgi:DNA mismatch repair protein MutS2